MQRFASELWIIGNASNLIDDGTFDLRGRKRACRAGASAALEGGVTGVIPKSFLPAGRERVRHGALASLAEEQAAQERTVLVALLSTALPTVLLQQSLDPIEELARHN